MSSRTEKLRVAAMLAAPYSGATLFAIMLNRHRDISCDGETFSRRPEQECSCGSKQSECEYFRAVAGHMLLGDRSGWDPRLFDHVPRYVDNETVNRLLTGFLLPNTANKAREALLAIPPLGTNAAAFLEAQEEFIANSLSFNHAKLYVDGSKIPRRVELLAKSGRFDLSIVHLIRDGRGFCNSYRKNIKGATLQAAAREWNDEIRKVDVLVQRFPAVRVHRVRYEDLCNDLLGTFAALCSFLGVEPDDGIAREERGTFHVIGNRMRKTFTGVIKEDLSWQLELQPEERAAIETTMEAGLRRFGYMSGPIERNAQPVQAAAEPVEQARASVKKIG